MIDTLFVATTTIQDTLRIILNSADKQNVWAQNSPLIIAFGVVFVASIAQIVVAIIYKKQYEKNREVEKMKIKSDLILKDKQKSINDFTIIIYDLSCYLDEFSWLQINDVATLERNYLKLRSFENKLYLISDKYSNDIIVIIDYIHEIEGFHKEKNHRMIPVQKISILSQARVIIDKINKVINT